MKGHKSVNGFNCIPDDFPHKSGSYSNCCGAEMYHDSDICPDCKEHCEAEDLDEFNIEESANKQSELLKEIAKNVVDFYNLTQEMCGSEIRMKYPKGVK